MQGGAISADLCLAFGGRATNAEEDSCGGLFYVCAVECF